MNNYPDMDEMIRSCEEKKTDAEMIVFALGAGRVFPKLGMRKAQKKAMDFIKKQRGFIGFHPMDLWHTLLVYRTLNDAKRARNELIEKGVDVGQVAPIIVPIADITGGDDGNDNSRT